MAASGKGVPAGTLRSISTPDRVESRLGALEFDDGAPAKSMAGLLYDLARERNRNALRDAQECQRHR